MSLVKKYIEINDQIKSLEKQKTELRAEIMGIMGSNEARLIDGVMITIEHRERATLDREALTVALGAETVKQYLKITQYSELRLKNLA